jgi:hypothetical protein
LLAIRRPLSDLPFLGLDGGIRIDPFKDFAIALAERQLLFEFFRIDPCKAKEALVEETSAQLLSATKGQLPLRSGLSPNCWSALVGALAGIVDAGFCHSFRKFLMGTALVDINRKLVTRASTSRYSEVHR